MNIVQEVLKELRNGVSERELALRYGLSLDAIYNYKTGRRRGAAPGRPRVITEEEAATIFEVWSKGEANMYELASIYKCSVQTIRNYMKARL